MDDIGFILLLTLFLGHELDAIHRHEWRLFPVLRRMDDTLAYLVFLALHLPIILAIVWLGFLVPATVAPLRIALAGFAIIHAWLHWLFRDNPKNEFNNLVSQVLIWAAGTAGALYLALPLTGA